MVSVPLLDMAFLSEEARGGTDEFSARVGLVALRGSFTVASSHKLVGVISDDIKDHEVVIFDFAEASYIDDSAAMLMHQLIEVATHEHTDVTSEPPVQGSKIRLGGGGNSVPDQGSSIGILRAFSGVSEAGTWYRAGSKLG